jgi:hypothetical protein
MTITGRFAAITIAGEAIADSAVDILKVAYNELLRKRGDERADVVLFAVDQGTGHAMQNRLIAGLAISAVADGLDEDEREALSMLDQLTLDEVGSLPGRLDDALRKLESLGLAAKASAYEPDIQISAITPVGRIVAQALAVEFGTAFGTRAAIRGVSGVASDERKSS